MSDIQKALINACKISKDPKYAAKVQRMIDEAETDDGKIDHAKLKAAVNIEYGKCDVTVPAENKEDPVQRAIKNWKAMCQHWCEDGLIPFYYTYRPYGEYSIARGVVVARSYDEAYGKVANSIHRINAHRPIHGRISLDDAKIHVEMMQTMENLSDFVYEEEFME